MIGPFSHKWKKSKATQYRNTHEQLQQWKLENIVKSICKGKKNYYIRAISCYISFSLLGGGGQNGHPYNAFPNNTNNLCEIPTPNLVVNLMPLNAAVPNPAAPTYWLKWSQHQFINYDQYQ